MPEWVQGTAVQCECGRETRAVLRPPIPIPNLHPRPFPPTRLHLIHAPAPASVKMTLTPGGMTRWPPTSRSSSSCHMYSTAVALGASSASHAVWLPMTSLICAPQSAGPLHAGYDSSFSPRRPTEKTASKPACAAMEARQPYAIVPAFLRQFQSVGGRGHCHGDGGVGRRKGEGRWGSGNGVRPLVQLRVSKTHRHFPTH
jgi:hypothetical protein